jgi:transketolase
MSTATQMKTAADIDTLCINTIRTLSLDAVQKANSGHPGLPLGMAPAAYVLWTKFLRHNPKNPNWFNRDRFLLSAGHGSMLIYSLLHLTGYGLSLDELKNFRQLHSKTPGHPENILTPGVEITTGPLGQGFANGVGMGIAQKHLEAMFNRKGHNVIDHFIYCICSDGDLMEGVSYESASLAGHLGLDNLIYLYDDNQVTIDGPTSLAFSEDVTKRFEASGWEVSTVEDGNDLSAIENAIREAQNSKGKPKLIRIKTIIGFGMPKQGTNKAHSDAPGPDAVKETKRNLDWPENKSFFIPKEVSTHFRRAIKDGARAEKDWNEQVRKYEKAFPDLGKTLRETRTGKLPAGWENSLPKFDEIEAKATRAYSGDVSYKRDRGQNTAIDRRFGRPDTFKQYLHQIVFEFRSRPIRQPQHPFRHPRTRDGLDDERNGAVWQCDPFRRNVPNVLRLHAARDPVSRLVTHPGPVRFHS